MSEFMSILISKTRRTQIRAATEKDRSGSSDPPGSPEGLHYERRATSLEHPAPRNHLDGVAVKTDEPEPERPPRRSLAVFPARVRRHAENPFDVLLRLAHAHAARCTGIRREGFRHAIVLEAQGAADARFVSTQVRRILSW